MMPRIALIAALVLTCALYADDDEAARAKLMTSWQSADASKDPVTWTFTEKFNDKGSMFHVINTVGGRPQFDFECDSLGHECAIKVAGHPAKVSLWYNGPKLVEMEMRGATVVKRTFMVTGEDTMEMEQTQIAPTPKAETVHFKRTAPAASH